MTATLLAVGVGAVAIVVGVAGLAGPWWALVVAGTFALIVGVLVYDPEPRKTGSPK